MDKDYLQALRYKLQKRIRKLNSSVNSQSHYHLLLKQFLAFLREQKTIAGMLDGFEAMSSSEHIVKELENIRKKRDYKIAIESRADYAAMCYCLVRQCGQSNNEFEPIELLPMLTH